MRFKENMTMFRWLLLASVFQVAAVLAQTQIYVRGAGKMFPIALPVLCGSNSAASEIPRIINRDLDLSGYFKVLPQSAYIETAGRCVSESGIAYSDWTVIGAEGLVKGVVESVAGRLKIQLFLHDVQKQVVVLGKEYETDAGQVAKVAHKFANEIMKFFTGEAGVFGSQIAFSGRVGRFKDLFLMDMDGSNVKQLTNEKSLAVSPSWDPTGTKIVYTSYRTRVPDLFLYDLASRGTKQISRGSELEVGAHFSPDGNKLVVSRTEGSESDLVLMNFDGTIARKLTAPNRAIDVSPVFSPDGSELVFCSNRGGGPQIYKMGAAGEGPKRVSFVESSYCTSPSWSPKGDKIAFVCRADGGFQIFVSEADGSNPIQLTSGGDNEDPDWSPDGRYLVFSTTSFGVNAQLALMRSDGSNIKRLTESRFGDMEPTWSPIVP